MSLTVDDGLGVADPEAAIPCGLSWTPLSKMRSGAIIAASNTLGCQQVAHRDCVNDVDPALHDLEVVWLPIVVAGGGCGGPTKVHVVAVIIRGEHGIVLAARIIVVYVPSNGHQAAVAGRPRARGPTNEEICAGKAGLIPASLRALLRRVRT